MTQVRRQILAYGCAASACLVAAHVLVVCGRRGDFAPYFGAADPRLALIVVSVIGAAALAVLSKRGWRSVVLSERTREAALWVALAAPFAVLAIGADLLLRFPRDINVPAPWSVLFYPTMGFVVEGVFHALPLALLALPFGASLRTSWIWLAPVALIEPVFQVREAFADSRISALEGFVFLQVLAINIVELHVFRRHGFLSAWSFRLSYYLLWHVAWGHLRLL